MREHGLVTTAGGIYRVFGVQHPADGTLALMRYYRGTDGWRKPPVYACEVDTGAYLDRYDVPTRLVDRFGIRLGLLPVEPAAPADYTDPLSTGPDELLVRLAGESHPSVGYAGSRLAGLHRTTSDVDLVIYGPDAERTGRAILARADREARPASRSLDRLAVLLPGTDRLGPRNVFKGTVEVGGRPTTLDVHYSPTSAPVVHGALATGRDRTTGEQIVDGLVVDDDRRRIFFPGDLMCHRAGRGEIRLWILDHVLHYVLRGDRLTVRARIVEHEHGQDLVGTELLALRPGRAAR